MARKTKAAKAVGRVSTRDVSEALVVILGRVAVFSGIGDARPAYRELERIAETFKAIEPDIQATLAEIGVPKGLSLSHLLPEPKDPALVGTWRECCRIRARSAHGIAARIVSSMLRAVIVSAMRVPRNEVSSPAKFCILAESLSDGARQVEAARPFAKIIAATSTVFVDAIRAEREGSPYIWPASDSPGSPTQHWEFEANRVRYDGREYELGGKPNHVLRCLVNSPLRDVPRQTILDAVWGLDNCVTDNAVDRQVAAARAVARQIASDFGFDKNICDDPIPCKSAAFTLLLPKS